jgi:Ca2+-binding RTX toxin-like protein
MTTYTVSSAAQLTTTLASAKGGDVITLASGNYGDVSISGSFSSDVTITSQNATSPAIFHTLTLNSSSHLKLDSLDINATPTTATYTWSPAVAINDSSYITFAHSTVTGGAAVSGVSQSAAATDFTGNVIGMPTGYGVTVTTSNNVKVDAVEVSQFYKGVVLYKSDYVTVSNSDIHDTRTTSIVAGGGNHITIDSNHLHDVNPWKFGPTGDHADYLAMWTNAGQTSASTDIKVTNNLMEQGAGAPVLGMWLQGADAGYTNVQISGNSILAGNFQGIVLSEVTAGTVDHNTLLQTSGANLESAPSILLASGSEKISVHDNLASAYNDTSGSTGALANTIFSNTIMQKWIPSAAGYYTDALIKATEALYDTLVSAGGSTSTTPVVTTPVVTPPQVVTPPVVTTPVVTTPTTPTASGNASAPVETTPSTGTAGQVLTGSWDWAKLVGTAGNDTFMSKTTGDTLAGGAGDDVYNLIGGSKTLVVEAAGGGVDTVISKGDYTLGDNVENLTLAPASDNWGGTGNGLNNVIVGNAGGNFLLGLAGNDTIDGGAGNDYIYGGLGNDRLTGGLGKDIFRFDKGSGQDVVTDFNKAQHDVIDLTAYYKLGLKATLVDIGADVKISFNTGDSITLTGIHASDLTATWNGFTA